MASAQAEPVFSAEATSSPPTRPQVTEKSRSREKAPVNM